MLATMREGGPGTAMRGIDGAFIDIVHAGHRHRVAIKRIANARRMTLRVRAATRDVVLTVPVRASLSRATSFVERHAAWIGVRIARLPVATPFGVGAVIPLRGVPHEIAHRPGTRGNVWIEASQAEASPQLCVRGDAPFVARRVKDYLMKEARADLAAAVARHAARLGTPARRMSLRDTTSRWGSCSASGALNFSWRLIMAPPHVLDYLAAHEVAHLRHMNHSAAFWATVSWLVPDYCRAEAWLKASGAGLMRFGSADGPP